eukprot:gene7311-11630_t
MNLILTGVCVIITSLFLLFKYLDYRYYSRVKDTKTCKTIPGDTFLQFIWSVFRKENLTSALLKKHKTYGQTYGSYVFGMFHVVVSEPEMAKKSMVDVKHFPKFSEEIKIGGDLAILFSPKNVTQASGDMWKSQRKSMDPGFYDLSIYEKCFFKKSQSMMEYFEKNGKIENIGSLMKKMTLDILGITIFEHDFKSVENQGDQEIYQSYNTIVESLLNDYLVISLVFLNSYLPIAGFHPKVNKVQKAASVFLGHIRQLVETSKKKVLEKGEATCLLDFMSRALIEDEEITQEELEINTWVFFLAGHETTATTLTFLLQLLAIHPEIQEKARKEVIDVCGKDGEITRELANKFVYLPLVLKETLRKYSIAPFIQRVTSTDTTLGDIKIKAGTNILVHIQAVHENKEIYGDPENFRPERWTEEEQKKRKIPHSAYAPFALGSRICIGNNFALLEQKIFVANLLRNYTIKMDGKQEVELDQVAPEPKTNLTSITTSLCGDGYTNHGYTSFSFSKTPYINQTYCEYIFHSKKRIPTPNEQNHCYGEQELVYGFSRGNWDLTSIKIKIPSGIINTSDYVIVKCHDKMTNFSNDYLRPTELYHFQMENLKYCNPFTCSKHLGSVYLFYYFIDQLGLLILIILSLLSIKWQPSKSRGILLIGSLMIEFIRGLFDIIPYVATVQFAYRFENSLTMIISTPLQITVYILILINFLRMGLVLYIQRNLDSLHKNQLSTLNVLLIRFMKNLTSNTGAVVFGVTLFLLHSLAFLLVILTVGSFDQELGPNIRAWGIIAWYLNLSIIIFVLGVSIITVLDFLMNIDHFFCNWKKFWLTTDPFRFRLQQFSFIMFLLFEGPYYMLGLYQNIRGNSVLQCLSHQIEDSSIFLSTLRRATLIFYLSGFILFYTLIAKFIDWIKTRNHNKNSKQEYFDTIDDIFRNIEKYQLFKEFITSEYSTENMFLYEDIKKYENLDSFDERKEFGNEIFSKYLNGQMSELEANIPGAVINFVSKSIHNDLFDDDLFDPILIQDLFLLENIKIIPQKEILLKKILI